LQNQCACYQVCYNITTSGPQTLPPTLQWHQILYTHYMTHIICSYNIYMSILHIDYMNMTGSHCLTHQTTPLNFHHMPKSYELGTHGHTVG
jgi:hypothetical protein